MNAVEKSTRHYLALDGLRGVAALVVVGLHVTNYFQVPLHFAHAYLAVDFFFMLSGFVICHAYERRLQTGMRFGAFVTVRLIRLYPLVLLGIVIGTAALLARAHLVGDVTMPAVLRAAAANMFLLPATALLSVRPWAFPIDGPLWSLSVEMAINLIYAACFKFLTGRSLIAVLVIGAVLMAATSLSAGSLDTGFRWSDFYLGGVRVLFPFVAGILLCRWLRRRPAQSSWGHWAWLPLLALLTAPKFLAGFYDAAAVLLAFPLILGLAAHAGPQPLLDRVWRGLGGLSYPLYVIHYPFVIVFSNLAHQHHLAGRRLDLAALATFAGVIALSVAALNFYDMPLRRFLTARFGARSARGKVAVSYVP